MYRNYLKIDSNVFPDYSTIVQLTDSSDIGRRRRPSMRQFQAPSLVQSLFICELCLTTG
jgi:hypothetical protein